MNKYFSILFSLFILNVATAETKPIVTKIDQVTVFRSGAQIKRTAKVTLKAGENEVIITDLPSGFDESSIIVNTFEKTSITGVSYKNNFAKDFSSNAEYAALSSQLKTFQLKKENENIVYETWREEELLITSNKKLTGDNVALTAAQLTSIADLYRTRLLDIKQKLLDSKRRIDDIDKDIVKLQAQINEWTNKNANQNTGEVVVMIQSPIAMESNINLSYIDPRASWNTSFDLRLENLQKPLSLVNKGKVVQYTGEEWKDIKLVLSTGNPGLNTQAPNMTPWFLYYINYAANGFKNKDDKAQVRAPANFRPEVLDGVAVSSYAPESHENITFMEHTFPSKMNLPSDGKEHEVVINENEIKASYKYLSIPKLDCKTYLIADILDWDQYSLSSGDVKLYFEGTYIGNTYLNVNVASDTLAISLGPDIAISTKREKLKDFKSTKFLSSKKEMQVGYELILKNNKPVSIDVTLKDQIPLATDADTEVEVEELSGGKLNKETGIIEWKLTLKPGEQVKKRMIYKVRMPKDKTVNL